MVSVVVENGKDVFVCKLEKSFDFFQKSIPKFSMLLVVFMEDDKKIANTV